MDLASELIDAARELSAALAPLRFGPPVAYVYDPLDYAFAAYRVYVQRYGSGPKHALFVGMNPGPFGMAQTGVPFGVPEAVRDWLRIDAPTGRPAREHPKRPVLGLDCPRREVSGTRLWGAIRQRHATPESFFARHFLGNYCPLLFLDAGGRNLTPDKLPAAEQTPLNAACDRHLLRVALALRPAWVVGIGSFAQKRASAALDSLDLKIGRITHPSPANPRASHDWAGTVERELREQGICS